MLSAQILCAFDLVVLSDGDNEPAAKQARLQSISLTDDLPQEVSTALLRLISRHPGLERVTISRSRKGIYSIYVSHAAGTKPLTRPSRKAEGIHAIISNWLDQFVTTAPAASEPTVVTLEPLSSATSTSAGLWVASMLQSHIELSELSAIEVDGVIIITAEHEETGYGIERCYTSWELATDTNKVRKDKHRVVHPECESEREGKCDAIIKRTW